MNPDQPTSTPSTNDQPVQPVAGSDNGQPVSPTPGAGFNGPAAPVGPQPPVGGAPDSPFGPPPPASSLPPLASGGSGKKLILLIVGVVVLAGLAVGGYFIWKAVKHNNQTSSADKALKQSSQTGEAAGATDASQLSRVTFDVPSSAIANLQDSGLSGNPNAKLYQTADGKCVVAWGTATADLVPGNSTSEIVSNYLDKLHQAGATVSAPVSAPARILKTTTGASYSIPTLKFTFTQGPETVHGLYSAAVLKDGTRLIEETACQNGSQAADEAGLAKVEEVLNQIRLKVGQ